ncbi:hypothetical protein FQR65_LT14552 [Abscondita terminalis]|nr:hypothetical protein FQR65_LT14552 [Abscondita terminalis]
MASRPSCSSSRNDKRPLSDAELLHICENWENEHFGGNKSDDQISSNETSSTPSENESDYSEDVSTDNENDEFENENTEGRLADVTITPTSQWLAVTGNYQQHFQFQERSGVIADIPDNAKAIDIFFRFVSDDILDLIVRETNRNAQQTLNKRQHTRSSRLSSWVPTNTIEIKKFFGLLLWMGLVRHPTIESYWSRNSKYKNDIAPITMPRNKFEMLLRFWHFSNNEEAPENDRLFKVRHIVELLTKNYQTIMKPDLQIAVDETMVPFRGRLIFRQYIPGKRHKYGIKLFKMCGSEGYTYNLMVYQGKHETGKHDLSSHVVMELCKDYLDKGRILITDNFYTNLPLAHELLKRNTHSLGTVRKNRKGLPKEVVSAKINKGDVVGKENEQGVVIAKWRDKREVLILSTHHTLEVVNTGRKNRKKEDICKPKFILDYNAGKAGIDLSDQLSSYSSPVRKSIRWYHKLVTELLFGTSVVNAYIVFKLKNPNFTNVSITKFREMLVDSLLLGNNDANNIEEEKLQPPKKQGKIKHKLQETMDKCGRNRKIRKRCYVCYNKLTASEGKFYDNLEKFVGLLKKDNQERRADPEVTSKKQSTFSSYKSKFDALLNAYHDRVKLGSLDELTYKIVEDWITKTQRLVHEATSILENRIQKYPEKEISEPEPSELEMTTTQEQTMASSDPEKFVTYASKVMNSQFDGTPSQLPAFLDALALIKLNLTGNETIAATYVRSKLVGKARLLISNDDTLDTIKRKLITNIKEEDVHSISAKMKNLKQLGKTSEQISTEMENLTLKMKSSYIARGMSEELTEELSTDCAVKSISKIAITRKQK